MQPPRVVSPASPREHMHPLDLINVTPLPGHRDFRSWLHTLHMIEAAWDIQGLTVTWTDPPWPDLDIGPGWLREGIPDPDVQDPNTHFGNLWIAAKPPGDKPLRCWTIEHLRRPVEALGTESVVGEGGKTLWDVIVAKARTVLFEQIDFSHPIGFFITTPARFMAPTVVVGRSEILWYKAAEYIGYTDDTFHAIVVAAPAVEDPEDVEIVAGGDLPKADTITISAVHAYAARLRTIENVADRLFKGWRDEGLVYVIQNLSMLTEEFQAKVVKPHEAIVTEMEEE